MKRSNHSFTQPVRQSYVAIIMIVYKYYKIILRQIIPILLIIFVGGSNNANRNTYILYGVIAIAVISMVVAIIAFFRFYFHIEDDELIVQKGILVKKKTSIPFDRIQTVNIEQNLIHQMFNVVKVEIDTAGSNKNEFEFDAISGALADELRSLVLARKKTSVHTDTSGTEMKDVAAEHKEDVILTIGIPKLFKIGITS